MEKQRERAKEVSKEIKQKTDKELDRLRNELERLKKLKEQKLKEEEEPRKKESEEEKIVFIPQEDSGTMEEITPDLNIETTGIEKIEEKLSEMDEFLSKELERIDHKTYEKNAEYIESQLIELEKEIVGETGLIKEELSPYEKLLENHPWLEEPRYEYMYHIPNKTKNPNDFESWQDEWGKVLFDYARYAILHILYLTKLYSEDPFSKFKNRKKAIKEIADKLVVDELGEWLSKKQDKIRIYWKTLDIWAEEIYDWVYEMGKLDPILIYEIRDANQEFSSLPKEEIEKIFNLLNKDGKGKIIKTTDGHIAFKIKIE
ncbi:MAG: hypothetical protein KGD63_13710 [Candidatus Lokiarchaeota archaeon]|nr:hypothetical protein [Candidatus Lokiarchaeota archaeon]